MWKVPMWSIPSTGCTITSSFVERHLYWDVSSILHRIIESEFADLTDVMLKMRDIWIPRCKLPVDRETSSDLRWQGLWSGSAQLGLCWCPSWPWWCHTSAWIKPLWSLVPRRTASFCRMDAGLGGHGRPLVASWSWLFSTPLVPWGAGLAWSNHVVVLYYYMSVSINGGTPSHHPF